MNATFLTEVLEIPYIEQFRYILMIILFFYRICDVNGYEITVLDRKSAKA